MRGGAVVNLRYATATAITSRAVRLQNARMGGMGWQIELLAHSLRGGGLGSLLPLVVVRQRSVLSMSRH